MLQLNYLNNIVSKLSNNDFNNNNNNVTDNNKDNSSDNIVNYSFGDEVTISKALEGRREI